MGVFNPKVSVMIVAYNQEEFIRETIESVLLQDYDNLEIVVADDASVDHTADIVMEYAQRYPRKVVSILNKVNLGITGNCNAAFFACTGELIATLGGDDLYLPGKLSAQVKLFIDDDVVLSYHSVEIFQHQTGKVLFTTNTTKNEVLNDVYDIISKVGIPGASSVMVRRSACPLCGFDTQLPVVSDWLFFIEVAMRGRVAMLSGVFGRYRKHGKGASEHTYNLLSESLLTLDVIRSKYPSDLKLKRACQRGVLRYLLGELFRQVMNKDKNKIGYVVDLLLKKSNGWRHYIFVVLSILFRSDCFIKGLATLTGGFRFYLKRIV